MLNVYNAYIISQIVSDVSASTVRTLINLFWIHDNNSSFNYFKKQIKLLKTLIIIKSRPPPPPPPEIGTPLLMHLVNSFRVITRD